MSNGSDFPLPDSPHSASDLQAAVADAVPGSTLRDATEFEEGLNTVYLVTVETDGEPRELILKVATHHFDEGCRAEPHVLDAVAERTDISVPEVVGTGHLRDDPYFLAERVDGEAIEADPERLALEAFERVCVEAGRNLGELHGAFPADGWGMLGLERGAEELHFVREFPDWPTYFEAWLTHNAERLEDTRFADLVAALNERATTATDELRELGPFDPVITHGDYRLANLLVDPETGETNAVIDWAIPTAVPAVHDLAVTEAILLDWPVFDEVRQRHLRERFYDGYREENDAVLDRDGFEAHRRLCWFGARLRLMVNLDEEMVGRSEEVVDARAREHREALRKFGVE